MKFLNGEKFKEVADLMLDEESFDSPRQYKNNSIIFCKTDFIPILFQEIYNLPYSFILITHKSDYEINEYIFTNKPKSIKKWYAQNVNYKHDDLIPLPIGIENHTGPSKGGSTDFDFLHNFDQVLIPEKIKNKIYCNFNLNNHHNRNSVLNSIISKNVAFADQRKPFKDYWNLAINYKFIASPRGNGIDCHRTWEALAMGSIPIVDRHFMYDTYNLPIIQIDNWNDINIDDLNKQSDNFNFKYPYLECDIDFWHKKIQQEKENLTK